MPSSRATTRILAAFLPLCLAACMNPGPGATVRKFYHAVEAGEIEAALDLLSAETVSTVGEDKLRTVLRSVTSDIDDKDGIRSFELTEEKVLGEIAEVHVHIVYGNGEEADEETKLVQEKGRWRIQLSK